MKILILENDVQAATMRSQWFLSQSYFVQVAVSAEVALECLETNKFDAILLGKLPDVSPDELCRRYRQRGGQTPILVISSDPDLGGSNTGTPASVEAALDSGADDFVSSSCPMSELAARIRALLRRPPSVLNNLLQAGTITLNVNESIVIRNGVEIHLHPMEFNLLEFLLRHPNQVFTARTLHERVWRGQVNRASSSDTVRTHIKTLRKKIDIPGTKSLITSVQGRGYKLSL